eukprot:Awhi_evm2s15341
MMEYIENDDVPIVEYEHITAMAVFESPEFNGFVLDSAAQSHVSWVGKDLKK